MSRHRTRHLLPAAAAVLALALAGCGSTADDDEAAAGSTAASTSETPSEETSSAATMELTVDEASAAGRCMVPTAQALANETTAFEGAVTELEDGLATLDVHHWYTGGEADQVTVAAPDADMQELLVAVDFEVGKSYLVSATDGQVSLCGFTAEKTPELEALYAEAFAS